MGLCTTEVSLDGIQMATTTTTTDISSTCISGACIGSCKERFEEPAGQLDSGRLKPRNEIEAQDGTETRLSFDNILIINGCSVKQYGDSRSTLDTK